jgi:DNA repair exonuclease SbcCD ATPase subunit
MKLLKLTLKNFKGIRDFSLEANGKNVNCYGDNATGKTTIFDAFLWLLFDKDSKNRKDFELKTLDENNSPIHNLNHEVEGIFEVNGKQIILKKVFAEKWTKKRGSATEEFTGHSTDYFVNGVPVKKNEYETKIAEIANEEIFKLLTNPTYFNEHLHWQERRRILLEICGDITDDEVIASDPSLSSLPEILNGRKLEDHRKVIASNRTEINKELEKIPVRIDETHRSLPDITSTIDSNKAQELKKSIQEKQQELARIESGGELAEKKKQYREVEAEIMRLQTEYKKEIEAQVEAKLKEIKSLQDESFELQQKTKVTESSQIEALEKSIEQLRQKWFEIDSQEFTDSGICPTCKQPLPPEQIEETKTSFNFVKAEKLEQITAEGKEKMALLEKEKSAFNERVRQAEKAREELKKVEDEIGVLKNEIDRLRTSPISSLEYAIQTQKKQELEQAITNLESGTVETKEKIQQEIQALQSELDEIERARARKEQYDLGMKRIQELKEQEKELAKAFEKLESEMYLTEQFIRTKVNMLESKINSRFKLARFKLFEQQINGGLSEVCEALFNGVPYSGGLNNAARINVGLDIINTLSEHYGFTAPIFIDNAEAVTQLIDTRGQQIRLIVSEQDKALRIVAHQELKEAV